MEWLFPSIVATLCGTVILTGTYLYLYLYDRKRYLLIWTAGWAVYLLRFVFMLLLTDGPAALPSPVLSGANQLSALVSGVLLLWGTYDFLGRSLPRLWIYLSVLNVPWILLSNFLGFSFLTQTLPIFTFLGAVYAWTGIVFIRHAEFRGAGKNMTGWAFILWGIHKADYPFFRTLLWFAPWGYLIGATLGIFVAIGMLLIYFQTTRERVEKSEKHFRLLVENSPIPMVVIDRENNLSHLNQKFIEIFGYGPNDLHKLDDWWPLAHPDPACREQARREWEENTAGALRENREIVPREFRITCKDGSERVAVIWGCFVDDRLIVILNDITERKNAEIALQRSERRFRDLAENSTDWVWEFDEREVFTYVSPRIKNLLGYEPEEVVGRKTAFDFIPSPEKEKVRAEWELIKAAAIPFSSLENVNQHKDGRLVILESSGVPVFDEQEKFCGYRGIDRDITERRQLESQLRQAQKMEAIGTLAGGIAHDFNNVLAAILGYSEMAMELMPAGHQARNDLQEVIKAGNRAKDLVHHILTFSRKTEHDLEPLQVSLMVTEVLKLLRASIPTTIEIRQQVAPDCGYVLADPAQVHQILMNLCTNAAQAMEEQGGVLEVRLENLDLEFPQLVGTTEIQKGSYLHLSVGDSGEGIEPRVMDRIFEPYFTTKSVGKGSGMGLAVVHGIVEGYGGSIAVESAPGQGTTFHICIPRLDYDGTPVAEPAEFPHRGNGKILVIDDEEALAKLARMTLERLGYRVTSCTDSKKALEIFQAQPDAFDLVITDQTMPGMTGYELARKIMAIRPDFPVILCTGYSSTVSEEKARAIGVTELLLKPISKPALSRVVYHVLQRAKQG